MQKIKDEKQKKQRALFSQAYGRYVTRLPVKITASDY